MFPCCNNTYVKYINEDKTIDQAVVEELELKQKDALEKKRIEEAAAGRPYPVKFKPISCKCPCHMKGMNVRH